MGGGEWASPKACLRTQAPPRLGVSPNTGPAPPPTAGLVRLRTALSSVFLHLFIARPGQLGEAGWVPRSPHWNMPVRQSGSVMPSLPLLELEPYLYPPH